MLFGVNILGGPKNTVLDGVTDPHTASGDSMQLLPNYFGLLLLSLTCTNAVERGISHADVVCAAGLCRCPRPDYIVNSQRR